MTTAQLAPPAAAPGADSGLTAGQDGSLATPDEGGGFILALDGAVAQSATQETAAAAGPVSGELPNSSVADADGQTMTLVGLDDAPLTIAPAQAAADAPALGAAIPPGAGTSDGSAVAGSSAGTTSTSSSSATALAPGRPDTTGAPGAAPGAVAAPATARTGQAEAAAIAQGAGDRPEPSATAAPLVAAGKEVGRSGREGGVVTLTLTPVPEAEAAAESPQSPIADRPSGRGATSTAQASQLVQSTPIAPSTRPGSSPRVAESGAAPVPAAPAPPAPAETAGSAGQQSGAALSAAPGPVPVPLGEAMAAARSTSTVAHQLSRELGTHIKMAVREGGRELLVQLKPPELGHLTIRVTVADGAIHAHIIADRPEAARMLSQAISSLGQSLAELGLDVQDLDVALGGETANGHADEAGDGSGATASADRGTSGDEDLEVLAAQRPSPDAVRDVNRLDLLV